ncbi:MAG TPA: LuxR C-terminal-related transcriptional regulator, partial [Jatrophihabitantaceae bacterium]
GACDADRATVARLVSRGRGTTALRVSAAVVHAVVAADTAVTAAECERAVTAAAVAERSVAGVPPLELAAIVHVATATAVTKACGAVEAAQAWSDALAASTLAGSSRLRRTSLAGLALAAALTGRLCQAVECGQAAEQLADESGLARDERPAAAPLALAWAMCERLQHAQARHWSAVAQESAPDPALCDLVLAILRARLLRSRRDTDAAVETLEPLLHAVDPPPWLQERARAELARARAAEPDAGPRFAPREMADDPAASLDVRVDAALSRACVLLEQRDVQAAVAEARQAWQLAEREQLRRPFLDSGPALRRLLRSHPALAPVAGWLGRSTSTVVALRQPAAAPSRTAQPQPVTTVDALTERETEVLRLLAELLSTEEIGAAMFVSVNTVRTHIRSILRKLAVSRRNEAVRRARELALV